MVITLGTIFLVLALVSFILAACNVPRFNWVPIGLALCVGALLIRWSPLLLR